MKVWVEIVAIDGRRIKNPIREDYEDHHDDDPIFAPHVVAEGFTYWARDSYFGVPEHQRAYTRLGKALHAAGFDGVRSLGCIAHAGDGLYGFTVREGYEEPLPAKWAKMIYGRLERDAYHKIRDKHEKVYKIACNNQNKRVN